MANNLFYGQRIVLLNATRHAVRQRHLVANRYSRL